MCLESFDGPKKGARRAILVFGYCVNASYQHKSALVREFDVEIKPFHIIKKRNVDRFFKITINTANSVSPFVYVQDPESPIEYPVDIFYFRR